MSHYSQHEPPDLYADDEIIDFYDDLIDDEATVESDTTLPTDTENQDPTPIIGNLSPIPVLTNLLSPSTPTTRLRREPTKGSRTLPPVLNANTRFLTFEDFSLKIFLSYS